MTNLLTPGRVYVIHLGVLLLLSLSLLDAQSVQRHPTASRKVGKDSISLCTRATEQIMKNGVWRDSVVKTWKFDDQHMLLSYLESDWIDGSLIPLNRYMNSTVAGLLVEQVGESWKRSQSTWQKEWKETFLYDSAGNCYESVYFNWDGTDYVPISQLVSSYTSGGRLAKIVSGEWSQNQLQNSRSTQYIYGSQGELLERRYFKWSDTRWVPDAISKFTYDREGREIEHDDSTSRELFSYSSDTRDIESIRQHFSFGKWTNEIKDITHLDADGNITEITVQAFSSPPPAWRNSQLRWKYEYQKVAVRVPLVLIARASSNKTEEFRLSHNFPNPFNATTQIQFTVPQQAQVTLKIYDILGRQVAVLVNETKEAGTYTIRWNAQNAASGAYFYQMASGGFVQTGKMALIK